MSGSILERLARLGRASAAARRGEHGLLAAETLSDPMIATHNIRPGRLEGIVNRGSTELVMPSVGIGRVADPPTGFGDVRLVAPPELYDPRRVQVFSRDAYTPRYPTESMHQTPRQNAQAARWYENNLGAVVDMTDAPSRRLGMDASASFLGATQHGGEYWADLARNPIAAEAYLRRFHDPDQYRLMTPQQRADLAAETPRSTIRSWLEEELAPFSARPVFDEYTPGGGPRRVPATPTNARRIMLREGQEADPNGTRMNLRAGENWDSDNRFLAQITPRFQNMEQLRASRPLLDYRTNNPYESWRAELSTTLDNTRPTPGGGRVRRENLGEAAMRARVGDEPFGPLSQEAADRFRARINDMGQTYHGGAVSPDDAERLIDITRRGRDLPTRYFEAKPTRNVPLAEFPAALVSEGDRFLAEPTLRRAGFTGDIISYNSPADYIARLRDLPEYHFVFGGPQLNPANIRLSAQDERLLPDEEGLL